MEQFWCVYSFIFASKLSEIKIKQRTYETKNSKLCSKYATVPKWILTQVFFNVLEKKRYITEKFLQSTFK